jgi:hypothetical protein
MRMNEWADAIQKELGLNVSLDVDALLNVARIAAHTVERPAAPITTYLVGLAVAQGGNLDEICKKIDELAKRWPAKI